MPTSEPAAVQIALGFQNDLIRRDTDAIMRMSARWVSVEASLDNLINEVAEHIDTLAQAGESIPPWKLYQLERYQALMAQLQGQMSYFGQAAIGDLLDDGKKAQLLAQKHAKTMAGVMAKGAGLGTVARADMVFDRLNVDLSEKIAGLARGGRPLQELMSKAWPLAGNGLTQKLITGAALGWNPRRMAQQAKLGAAQGFNHLLLVYRDQVNRNYRETLRELYDSSDLIVGYMRVASKSQRTCMACLRLDGTIYPTSTIMALHPQDRCTMVPLLRGVPIQQRQNGLDWFREQDPDLQRQMMGPKKWEAWRDGLFDLDNIVTVKHHPAWGPNANVTSLKSLLNGGGGLANGAPGTNGFPLRDLATLFSQDKAKQVAQQKAKPASQANQPQGKYLGDGDQGLAEDLADQIRGRRKEEKDPRRRTELDTMGKALADIEKGRDGIVLYDDQGLVTAAASYTKGLNSLTVNKFGTTSVDANLDALKMLTTAAKDTGLDMELYVPKDLVGQYKDWGFDTVKNKTPGKIMRLPFGDQAGFLDDPVKLGDAKWKAYHAAAVKALDHPDFVAEFAPGKANPLSGFVPEAITPEGIEAQKFEFTQDHSRLQYPEGKYKAAGMILVDEQSGKIVMVAPSGQYGGYVNTIPKGTKEPGDDLQTTAIKEAWEETGLKPKIVGFLGDYEKGFSVARYYVGVVKGGAPWALGTPEEAEAVKFVPPHMAADLLNNPGDKNILNDWFQLKLKATQAGNGDWIQGLADLDKEAGQKQAELIQLGDAWATKWEIDARSFTPSDMAEAARVLKKIRHPLADEMEAEAAEARAAQVAAQAEFEKSQFEAEALWTKWRDTGFEILNDPNVGPAEVAKVLNYVKTVGPEGTKWEVDDLENLYQIKKLLTPIQPPAEGLTTKKQLVTDLADQARVPFWKLNQLSAAEIKELYERPKGTIGDVVEAAEQGAAKYYQAKADKVALEQAKIAREREKAYMTMPDDVINGTKAQIVDFLVIKTGVTKWKIQQLSVDELKALNGGKIEKVLTAGETGAAQYYKSKADKKMAAKKTASATQDQKWVKPADFTSSLHQVCYHYGAQLQINPNTLYDQFKFVQNRFDLIEKINTLGGLTKEQALAKVEQWETQKLIYKIQTDYLGDDWHTVKNFWSGTNITKALEAVKAGGYDESDVIKSPIIKKNFQNALQAQADHLKGLQAPPPAEQLKTAAEEVALAKDIRGRDLSTKAAYATGMDQAKTGTLDGLEVGTDPVKAGEDIFAKVQAGELPQKVNTLTHVLTYDQILALEQAAIHSSNPQWSNNLVKHNVDLMKQDKEMALADPVYAKGQDLWARYDTWYEDAIAKEGKDWSHDYFSDYGQTLSVEDAEALIKFMKTGPGPWGVKPLDYAAKLEKIVPILESQVSQFASQDEVELFARLSADDIREDDDVLLDPDEFEAGKKAFDRFAQGYSQTAAEVTMALRYVEFSGANTSWIPNLKDEIADLKLAEGAFAKSDGVDPAKAAAAAWLENLADKGIGSTPDYALSYVLNFDPYKVGATWEDIPSQYLANALNAPNIDPDTWYQIKKAYTASLEYEEKIAAEKNVPAAVGKYFCDMYMTDDDFEPTYEQAQIMIQYLNHYVATYTGKTPLAAADGTPYVFLVDPAKPGQKQSPFNPNPLLDVLEQIKKPKPAGEVDDDIPEQKYDPFNTTNQGEAFKKWFDSQTPGHPDYEKTPQELGLTPDHLKAAVIYAENVYDGNYKSNAAVFASLQAGNLALLKQTYIDAAEQKKKLRSGDPASVEEAKAFGKVLTATHSDKDELPGFLKKYDNLTVEDFDLAEKWIGVAGSKAPITADKLKALKKEWEEHVFDQGKSLYKKWQEVGTLNVDELTKVQQWVEKWDPGIHDFVTKSLDEAKSLLDDLKPAYDTYKLAKASNVLEDLFKDEILDALDYIDKHGGLHDDKTTLDALLWKLEGRDEPDGSNLDPLLVKYQTLLAKGDLHEMGWDEQLKVWQTYPDVIKAAYDYNDKDFHQVLGYIEQMAGVDAGIRSAIEKELIPPQGAVPFPLGIKSIPLKEDGPHGVTAGKPWTKLELATHIKKYNPSLIVGSLSKITHDDMVKMMGAEIEITPENFYKTGQALYPDLKKGKITPYQLSEGGLKSLITYVQAEVQAGGKYSGQILSTTPEGKYYLEVAQGLLKEYHEVGAGLPKMQDIPQADAPKAAPAEPVPVSEKAPRFVSKAPKTLQDGRAAADGIIPLPKGKTLAQASKMSKAQLVDHISEYVTIPKSILNGFTVNELTTFMKAPDVDVDPIGKHTLDVSGADQKLKEMIGSAAKNDMTASYQVNGIDKFLGNVNQGRAFVYKDDQGHVIGVASWVQSGDTLKLSGASFANEAANKQALADGLKVAQSQGLTKIQTWVPKQYVNQYSAWGFKPHDSSYMVATVDTLSADVKSYATAEGATVKKKGSGPIPFPPGTANKTQASKLSKGELVSHFSVQTGIPTSKLNEVAKGDLVQLLGQENITQAVDQIVAYKETQADLAKAWTPYEAKGPAGVKTSTQGLKILQYAADQGIDIDQADIDLLNARIDTLAEEEKAASPYVIYDQRQNYTPSRFPPTATLPKHDDFPPTPAKLVKVKDLGGSTGATLVRDTETGKLFVRKAATARGGQDHLRSEASADAMYQAAGLSVPRFQLYETDKGPVKLSEYFEDGEPLGSFLKRAKGAEREAVLDQVRQGFAFDAFMGNWDVIGMSQDNILIRDGVAYRIDNGGSLSFRAQGGDKRGSIPTDKFTLHGREVDYIGGEAWSEYPDDLWSMRVDRGGASAHNARVFGDLSWYDITDQIEGFSGKFNQIVAAAPPEQREIVFKRLQHMRSMGQIGSAHKKDKFAEDHTERFSRDTLILDREGFIDALPKTFDQPNPRSQDGRVLVTDETGRQFDKMRGHDSTVSKLADYMRRNGMDHSMITSWKNAQAGNSWNDPVKAVKYLRYLQRPDAKDEYYWGPGGIQSCKREYDKLVRTYGEESVKKTFTLFQAFTFETVRNVEFRRNQQDRGYIEIGRTEDGTVVSQYGLKQQSFTKPYVHQVGAAESCSVFQTVKVSGSYLFLQRVPYHRIWGVYWHEKSPGSGGSGFLGNNENEFVCDLSGLERFHVGRPGQYEDIGPYWQRLHSEQGDVPATDGRWKKA